MYVYKYKTPEIGKQLYQEYTEGTISSEQDFVNRLKTLEGENTFCLRFLAVYLKRW